MAHASVAALRQFIRPRELEEHCDTCGMALTAAHKHTFEPASRQIRCACDSCAILYASVYRQIPHRIVELPHFQMSDAQWDELMIPISLAFFSYSTPAGKTVALYPSPAGAAESLLRLDSWEDVCAANPELHTLEPDVEALLVNRVGASHQYFLVPIDECYRLIGLIRLHWRGLSGGVRVWGEIAQSFDELRRKGKACLA
jgi:hypothetical protein